MNTNNFFCKQSANKYGQLCTLPKEYVEHTDEYLIFDGMCTEYSMSFLIRRKG